MFDVRGNKRKMAACAPGGCHSCGISRYATCLLSLSFSLARALSLSLRPGLPPSRAPTSCVRLPQKYTSSRSPSCSLALVPFDSLLVCPRLLPLAFAHSLYPNLSHSPRPISCFRIARLAHTHAHDPRTGPAGRVCTQLRCCTSAQAWACGLILWRLPQPLRDLALSQWNARTLREQQYGARHRGASVYRWHAEDRRGVHCVSAAAVMQRRPRLTLVKIWTGGAGKST